MFIQFVQVDLYTQNTWTYVVYIVQFHKQWCTLYRVLCALTPALKKELIHAANNVVRVDNFLVVNGNPSIRYEDVQSNKTNFDNKNASA